MFDVFIFLMSCVIILSTILLNFNFEKLTINLFTSWNLRNSHKTLRDIPGPLYIPLIGTKWIYFWKYKILKLHEAYADLNAKYGPIVKEITAFGTPIIHLFDRNDIEKVLRYPSRYPFRPPTEIVAYYRKSRPDRYASVGITNEQGENWLHLRSKLTTQITSPRILQAFLPTLNEICDDFVELLRIKRDSKTLFIHDFQDVANLMGLEAVCTLMLGKRLGFLATHKNQPEYVGKLAHAVKQLFISQRDSYYGLGLWKYIPTRTYRIFSESEEVIYNIVSDMVDKAYKEEQLECSLNDVRSIFLSILQTEGLDERDKKSAIIDFIAAGIETLANTLIFALFFISKHNNAQSKIVKEFETCINNCILQNNLTSAIFTKACLHETYRIQPTAFCLARFLEEDMILSGYHIKAGTVLLCQNMIACHKEENFKNAKCFLPERWIEKDKFIDNGQSIVVPFGIGKRTCPGKRFVEIELLLLITKLNLAFEIEFPMDLETEFEFLLVPKTPVNFIIKDRI